MDQLWVQIIAGYEIPDWNNYKYKANTVVFEIHMYPIPVESI